MIRILYMSDLHLELESWRLPAPGWPAFLQRHQEIPRHPARGPMVDGMGPVDLVLLAGDIHTGARGVIYADQLAKYLGAPVCIIAGNHEFYNHYVHTLLPLCRQAASHTQGRVQFLENVSARFIIKDQAVNVLGCTLWTDYELNGDANASMAFATRGLNDHKFIGTRTGRFEPADALSRHEHSRIWLHRTLARLEREDPKAQNVVLTHHAPSPAFLGPRRGAIAPAYASDMLPEFTHYPVSAWIHGHTHFRHETVESGIRVASAPRGYVLHDGADVLEYRAGIIEI